MAHELRIRTQQQTDDEIVVRLPDDADGVKAWQSDSEAWMNVMRNRGRWVGVEATLRSLYEDCREQLKAWGMDLAQLKGMQTSEIVEVSLPSGNDAAAVAARSMPWEFLLNATLTEEPGARQGPAIVRHLAGIGPRDRTAEQSPDVLFIQSSPGELDGVYEFDSEQQLVTEAFKPFKVEIVKNATIGELAAAVWSIKPAYVHLTGVDVRQGAQFLGLPAPALNASGVYMKSTDGTATVEIPVVMAKAVTCAGPVKLAAFNMYYSAELAACAVMEGADAAISFLAEFDDAVAEVFFTEMYRAISDLAAISPARPALQAFRQAIGRLLVDPTFGRHLEGAPIVIWCARSAVVDEPFDQSADVEPGENIPEEAPFTIAELRRILKPYVKFPTDLNYCGLHNGISVFDAPARIGLRNNSKRCIEGVLIEVSMAIGGEQFVFTRSCDITRMNLPIGQVHFPLTSEMARGLRERIQTNITVTVRYEGKTLFSETERVGLLATDEWQLDSPWLASFVLPRDPAVLDIVRWARPFLCAVADSTDAGFDNYNRLRVPKLNAARRHAIIDGQVQALWWTIRHRCRLSYISPPPTYTRSAQRIRTPSAVLHGRSGTCLDLALLMASCLTAVDLNAAIFVLSGHAFPAYYRTPEGHRQFRDLMGSKFSPSASADRECARLKRPWILDRDGFDAVRQLIAEGELVPIETEGLTDAGGFERAILRARNTLNSGTYPFQAIHDVKLAGEHNVTPLPIAGLI